VLVRSQFDVPPNVEVTIGATSKSDFPGFESLPITFSKDGKQSVVNFLLSSDGNTVARLERFDISHNPADTISIQNRPWRGTPDAKVTIVNFDDLECPYCARMHQELFPATRDHYKDLVRFVYKDDPLTDLHPWAMHAAVDANCLAAQSGDVYWTYVDYLHGHGEEITGSDRDLAKSVAALDRIAGQEATLAKLDETALNACIAKQDQTQILASTKLAEDLGIDGTPAVYVNGEKVNGGAVPEEELWVVIDRALRAAGEQPPSPPVPAQVPAQGPAASGPAATGPATTGPAGAGK
jgi:protein-disulfide isomerase